MSTLGRSGFRTSKGLSSRIFFIKAAKRVAICRPVRLPSPRSVPVYGAKRFKRFSRRWQGAAPSATVFRSLVARSDLYERLSASTYRPSSLLKFPLSPVPHSLGYFRLGILTRLSSLYAWSMRVPSLLRFSAATQSRGPRISHILTFAFRSNRLVMSLRSQGSSSTHFFLSPGLFLRFFNNKKSLKKKRALRILMARVL